MRLSNLETETVVPSKWAEENAKKVGFHPRPRIIIPIVLVVLLALGYWLYTTFWIVTTGNIVYTQVQVRPLVASTIVQLPVMEGQHVKQGQLLVQFANEAQRTELSAHQARLDAARAHLAILERLGIDPAVYARLESARGAAQATAAVQQRYEAAAQQSRLNYDRAKLAATRSDKMYGLRGITKEEWEKVTTEFRNAEQALQISNADLAKAKSDAAAAGRVLTRVEQEVRYQQAKLAEQIALARQQVAQIEGEVAVAARHVGDLAVYAPRDGIVGWVHGQVGENVNNNDVIAMIYDPSEMWVQAYVQGSDISYLEDGREARVSLQGEPGGTYPGRVALFFPDEVTTERESPLSRQPIRAASNIGGALHPVKIRFVGPLPQNVTPETIVRVRIRRR